MEIKDPKKTNEEFNKELREIAEQSIEKCIEKAKSSMRLDRPLTEKELKEMRAVLRAIYIEGKTPKEAMKIDDAVIDQFYSYAYNLYQAGKYKEASSVFFALTRLEPNAPRNTMGLAACFHKQQIYLEAAKYYYATSMLDAASPLPFFHMADCFIQRDSLLDAHIALTAAVKRCGDDPTYAVLKEKCHAMIASVEKTLNENKERGKPSGRDLVKQNTEKGNKAA